ncbi:MAG: hypothetical protein F4X58_01060 [Chloroflexi bacterium]|nr:hypothetical protein [Chloroflexota bacterium]MYC00495.1 hypothetical protein [Chloroflexota bacterium]
MTTTQEAGEQGAPIRGAPMPSQLADLLEMQATLGRVIREVEREPQLARWLRENDVRIMKAAEQSLSVLIEGVTLAYLIVPILDRDEGQTQEDQAD